ncbi:hypothetical protein MJG53_014110 [Ovis ammon polii x Ovis aries]|uniref:Uncharacterized protein n=1 Tax=Ovis ammon polii x Ovis aries TaxID=2918886 RepID=A0ACB9UKU9_9CETA|nr:hypothetical protein MJG53_014110 [Ovis ammon polii x Ovis aries]
MGINKAGERAVEKRLYDAPAGDLLEMSFFHIVRNNYTSVYPASHQDCISGSVYSYIHQIPERHGDLRDAGPCLEVLTAPTACSPPGARLLSHETACFSLFCLAPTLPPPREDFSIPRQADRTRGTANRAQRPRSRPHLRLWSDLAYRAKLGKGLSENQTRHLCKSADVFGRKLSTLYEASFSEETCHSAEHAVLLRLEPGRQEGSDKYCISEAVLTTESFFMCLLCASINISGLRRQATVPDQAAR